MAVTSEHFVADGASIIDTERKFKAEFCGLTITGAIDRIDRLPDGKVVAIDYKSGTYIAKIKDDDGYLKIDIQLPIYSRIAAPGLFSDAECAGGQFLHLSTPRVTKGKEADLETFVNKIKSLLAEGNFAVDPDLKREACKYCEYDIVCRTGPRLMRKHSS
jgi:ATP-dependent helicase/DNAse subunit B